MAVPLVASRSQPAAHPPFTWHDTNHVIAFGDSYTYVQGTSGYPKYSFIGSNLPGDFAFSPERLLENRIVQNYTSQSAGGPNWIEHLTGCAVEDGEHSPLDCDVQLWDFAVAGANTAEALLPLHHPFIVPLVNQTQQFLEYGDSVLREHAGLDPSKSLVAIWIGINDIIDAQLLNKTSPEFYAENIRTMFAQSVAPLVEAGYKNLLVFNLPPLDRSPLNRITFQGQLNTELIQTWNNELEAQTRAFAAKHKRVRIAVFDNNKLLNGILEAPNSYGIKNTTDFCEARKKWPQVVDDPASFGCLPVSEYFWFDSAHIGTKIHKALADGVRRFLEERF
ncbi:hypothetical protein AK830_g2598 [Neonectria ditissima]|uniref:SGNH hydrolase-type esterase domain-containing protein n=1 Tax=Neonectria ditissima TaxID=78410 RepID=A0A0P7BUT4_9HYPO|nr:hypothetical protein AK830_g2598 [Neonectria ditissima]